MTNQNTARQFASQFSWEDWSYLCSKEDFTKAVDAGEFDQAEIIAASIFAARDQTQISAGVAAQIAHEKLHAEATALIARWARATGREGQAHKQTRQNKIRRLMKNGIQSDYAAKLRLESVAVLW